MITKEKTKRVDSCIMRNFLVADDREANLTWLNGLCNYIEFIHLLAKKSRGKSDFRRDFNWSSNKVTNDLISCHFSPLPSAIFFLSLDFTWWLLGAPVYALTVVTGCSASLIMPLDYPHLGEWERLFWVHFFFFFWIALWDLSSLTSDQTWTMAVKALSCNHWTARKFLAFTFLKRKPKLSFLTSPYQSLWLEAGLGWSV